LKVWILVGLEGSLQGILRNGHLHTCRAPTGEPARRDMVMALKRRFARVSCDPARPEGPRDPPGLRRLRFPSFKTTCQRANRRTTLTTRRTRLVLETTRSLPGGPGREPRR
jgi:hypothetical protein